MHMLYCTRLNLKGLKRSQSRALLDLTRRKANIKSGTVARDVTFCPTTGASSATSGVDLPADRQPEISGALQRSEMGRMSVERTRTRTIEQVIPYKSILAFA